MRVSTEENKYNKPIILMVGPLPPPAGGISTVVQGLLKSSFLKLKYKISLVNSCIPRPRIKKGKIDIINLFAFAKQSILLTSAILKYNPAIVHIHTSGRIGFFKNSIFVLITKLLNRKILLSLHSSSKFFFIESNKPFIKNYTKFIFSICNLIHVLSHQDASQIIKNIKINQSRITIIPNSLNDKDFKTIQEMCIHKNYSSEIPVLIHIATLDKKKGTLDLIRSVSILKRESLIFKVLLVGAPLKKGNLEKIQSICKKEEVAEIIKLTGEINRSEVLVLLCTSDIFILPSYSEGLPLSLLEAMSAGLPIIATPVGGIPEVAKDGENALFIEPGNIKNLTNAIKKLILDENLRKNMGLRNKARIITKYTTSIQIKNLDKAYRKILKNWEYQ